MNNVNLVVGLLFIVDKEYVLYGKVYIIECLWGFVFEIFVNFFF